MATGFCKGCPTPENLAEYRAGRTGGGYFSSNNPEVVETACRLVELIASTDECSGQPEVEDVDDSGDESIRTCIHPAVWVMAQIGDAMETPGESPDVIVRIEAKRGEE